MTRLEIFTLAVAFVAMAAVIELVRRRQLREKYALLWLGVGAVFVVMAVARRGLDALARLLGIEYGPTLLFLAAILFLLVLVAHLSWEISRLEERTRTLAEEIALLRPRKAPKESDPVAEDDG